MKRIILLSLLLFAHRFNAAQAQTPDTVRIDASKVATSVLKPGIHRYLVYFQNGRDSSRVNYQLWSRKIDLINYQNKKAISVTQQWDDNAGPVHKVYSVCDRETFAPIYHESWWKTRGSSTFDFQTRKATLMDRPLTEADTSKRSTMIYSAFQKALNEKYVLNWHLDLEVFPILPYKENTTFLINFYDPGIPFDPQYQSYTVSGSDALEGFDNQKIDCWLLTHTSPGNKEVFWISKQTREVLKLEQEFNGRFRYKIKLGFSN